MSELQMKKPEVSSSGRVASVDGGSASPRSIGVEQTDEWWQQLDQRVYRCIKLWFDQWWEPQHNTLLDAVGEVFGEHRASVSETIAKLVERVIPLETTSTFEERLATLSHKLKRGSEIPQSELLAKIQGLRQQIDELKKVAAQPGPNALPTSHSPTTCGSRSPTRSPCPKRERRTATTIFSRCG